jgi:hypothetical protein
MNWSSIVAIYALFWVMTAFVILPIGVRTHEELGLPKTPGRKTARRAIFGHALYCCAPHYCRRRYSGYTTSITYMAGLTAIALTRCLIGPNRAYLRRRSMA